jgi:transcriptional regulator with XRE-family HTH domain
VTESEERAFLVALGARVREARMSQEWTQDRLATRSSLSRNFVSALERGANAANVVRVYRIVAALQVEPSTLIPPLRAGQR